MTKIYSLAWFELDNVMIVRTALVRLTNTFFQFEFFFKVEFTFSQHLAAQCRIAREEEWMKCHQSLINGIKWARAGVAAVAAVGGGGEILKFRGYTCGRYQTPGNSKIQDNSVWVSWSYFLVCKIYHIKAKPQTYCVFLYNTKYLWFWFNTQRHVQDCFN